MKKKKTIVEKSVQLEASLLFKTFKPKWEEEKKKLIKNGKCNKPKC